jgi:hypothetical protein
MKNFSLTLTALFSLISLFMASPSAFSEDDALLPPTAVHDSEEGRETIESSGDETNLNEELSAPAAEVEGAEVRSFERKDGAEVTEYSVHGKVYMIRVQPGGGLPAYYIYDSDGDGVFEQRLPGGYKRMNPPMWVIKKF